MQSINSDQPRIFLVGYARAYRLELADAFGDLGFDVTMHESTQLAAIAFSLQCPDAILINWIASPPLSTLEFIERYGGLTPVLVHTSHNVLMDKVNCLRAGAADYICGTCYFPEILARVERAQITAPTTRKLAIGELSLNVETCVAYVSSDVVHMTKREARMLAALIRCPEHPVARDALMRAAGINGVKATIVESYIKQLRARHPLLRRCVRTKYGQGYAFFP